MSRRPYLSISLGLSRQWNLALWRTSTRCKGIRADTKHSGRKGSGCLLCCTAGRCCMTWTANMLVRLANQIQRLPFSSRLGALCEVTSPLSVGRPSEQDCFFFFATLRDGTDSLCTERIPNHRCTSLEAGLVPLRVMWLLYGTMCGHPVVRGSPYGLMSRSRVLRLMRVVADLPRSNALPGHTLVTACRSAISHDTRHLSRCIGYLPITYLILWTGSSEDARYVMYTSLFVNGGYYT